MAKHYLGIDLGTQGLSIILTDEQMVVQGVGEGHYEMVKGLDEGCYEQVPADWELALKSAASELREKVGDRLSSVAAIGISGQMHGEVLIDADNHPLGATRLWCDSRNEAEGDELTASLGVKMPKRITAARWLWTIRNRPEIASQVRHLTTPAGWIAYRLTGEWNLGIGDAAGMFPIEQTTQNYDQRLLELFQESVKNEDVLPLGQLLPAVARAGEEAGQVTSEAADWLGVSAGIPVAAAEGDQPAALAGSLIGDSGMVSVSFGTSVCANSVGDRPFAGVSPIVDHFCDPAGKPINMVFLRNGTTFMNSVVEMLGGSDDPFGQVMPQVVQAAADCGGIVALPFMDDEPGLSVSRGGAASLLGLNAENATPGNAAKAALLSTMFNLRLGSQVLEEQRFPRTEIILTGGLTKTPELGQLLADVMNTPVTLLDSAEEGTAWGAALLAKYRDHRVAGVDADWSAFLKSHETGTPKRFTPDPPTSIQLDEVFSTYVRLMEHHDSLADALATE